MRLQKILFSALFALTALVSSAQWTPTNTRLRYPGYAFQYKDTADFTGSADTALLIRQGKDSTLYAKIKGFWRKVPTTESGDFIKNQFGTNLTVENAKFYINDTGWAAKLLRSNKGLIDSIQASSSAGGYLVTNGGAAVMHWGGGGSVEVDFKGFAGYDANRSSSYTARSFTDKGYVDSSFLAYTTLQNAYNNSSIPNITTNTTNRAVSIQRGTGADTDSVFVVRNGAGTVTSAITGDGRVLANKVNANDTIRTSGVGQFGDQFTIGFFTLPKLWVDGNAAINGTTLNINGSSPTYSIQTSPGVGATTSRLIVQSGGASAGTLSFPSLSTSRQWDLPNASGTIALTSNVTDSASALRASINTKLNISDTAGMLGNYLRKTDTATMLSKLTFDRVLANGNTTGRTFTAGGATLTGALSGTSGTFTGGDLSVVRTGVASTLLSQSDVDQARLFLLAGTGVTNRAARINFLNGATSTTVPRWTLINDFNQDGTNDWRLVNAANTSVITALQGGNVGIGTTSPTSYYAANLVVAAGSEGGITIANTGTTGAQYLAFADGTTGADRFRGYLTYNHTDNSMSIAVDAAIKFKLLSSGRALFNTETDDGSSIIQANGNVAATGASFTRSSSVYGILRVTNTTTDGESSISVGDNSDIDEQRWTFGKNIAGAGDDSFGFYRDGSTRFKLSTTGAATFSSSVTATGFIVSSDYRYKDIISQDGDLYTYTLKNDESKRVHYGYVAQDVEKWMPHAVSTNEQGYKAVNYIEVLAFKVRELEKQIEQLKNNKK